MDQIVADFGHSKDHFVGGLGIHIKKVLGSCSWPRGVAALRNNRRLAWSMSAWTSRRVTVVGASELAWQQSMARRKLQPADATGWTVRHPVRKSRAGAPE